jgi:hypothetical protein
MGKHREVSRVGDRTAALTGSSQRQRVIGCPLGVIRAVSVDRGNRRDVRCAPKATGVCGKAACREGPTGDIAPSQRLEEE